MPKQESLTLLKSFSNAIKNAEYVFSAKAQEIVKYSSLGEVKRNINSFMNSIPDGIDSFDSLLEEEFFHSHMSQEVILSKNLKNFQDLIDQLYEVTKEISNIYLKIQDAEHQKEYSIGIQQWFTEFNKYSFTRLSNLVYALSEKKNTLASFINKGKVKEAEAMMLV